MDEVKVRYRARRSSSSKISSKNLVKKTEKRSKSGCLTCRNRKKKCDEVKPCCKGCRRNFLQCVWPGEVAPSSSAEELSKKKHNYGFYNLTMHDLIDEELKSVSIPREKIPLTKKPFVMLRMSKRGDLHIRQKDGSLLPVDDFPTVDQLSVGDEASTQSTPAEYLPGGNPSTSNYDSNLKEMFDLQWVPDQIFSASDQVFNWFTRQDHKEGVAKIENLPNTSTKDIDALEAIVSNEQNVSSYNFFYDANDPLAQKYNSVLNKFDENDFSDLKEFSKDENFLIYACINRWLPRMGPQDTHPLLTTRATFTAHFESNYVIKEVFMCCGATFLEWYDRTTFGPLSAQLYASSLALITKYLSDNPFYGTEAWLLASYQLLCLRNKTTNTTSVDDCIYCLANSYRIIKATYYVSGHTDSKRLLFVPTETTQQQPVHNLSYEIENRALEVEEQIDNVKNHLILQPHERMFLESFVYNYSVAILWASDLTGLPNPFSIFKELSHVLKCPIYHCELQFMNNPIFGAAPDAFEILAKASYIARLPMPLDPSSVWLRHAYKLHSMASFYTSPVLPGKLDGSRAHENSRLNLHVGRVISKVCYLLLDKIIHYDNYNIVDAQPMVAEIIAILDKVPADNLVWGILLWATIACGVFAFEPHHQQRILVHLQDVGGMLHMLSIFETQKFLQGVWDQPLDVRLDALFLCRRKAGVKVNC
ncbi:ZYBA0S12-02212g1_1 [Zygosaccharomyces bailii CLIB 213]|uniref:ZYBA0S12-02212g1_1 n=1 Tax=Zygosaccharomyces bailii (strain CLIB 213 / ATCC 58445 / CBS 680 / BCRC 21525 / NBRC 1098 / NCYC 1416 / NRRL Y-2227) TaxID=1333698 RepID=A0A8J2T9W2_ZYGB2|nr:ZYBA0S12-02212g1_1 [Zygosaccharomyces bailii CLIB 213]